MFLHPLLGGWGREGRGNAAETEPCVAKDVLTLQLPEVITL